MRYPEDAATADDPAMPQLHGSGSLSDQIADILRTEIIERRLQPSARLNPDVLSRHFGVSRIPVREALRSLDAEGWVRIEPRKGARVRPHDETEFHALFETRAFIEGQVARFAARRRTEEHLAKLQELLALGWAAVRLDDKESLGRLNSEFHNFVAECAANPVLADISEHLGQTVRWYYSAVRDERATQSMLEHNQIMAAIAEQDEEAAASCVQRHVEATKEAVERAIAAKKPPQA